MIKIPPEKPIVPPTPPTPPPKKEEAKPEIRRMPREEVSREFYRLSASEIASRLAVLGAEAKKRELSFMEIIERVILETGITNPEAALEEANRRLQKEIEDTLEAIKKNKDLMDEEYAWQAFAELLESRLTGDQVKEFLRMVGDSLRGL